jgi:hypothetical protein
MLLIVIAMLVIVALAGGVVVFFAFPHRGREIPHAPGLSQAVSRAADKVSPELLDHDDAGPSGSSGRAG